jgi:hypothetical protein
MSDTLLQNLFTYHPPKGNQIDRYQAIREAGLVAARKLLRS